MIDKKRILCVIPARGGSKGIPHKNIKELAGKPLIYYSIDIARQIVDDTDICVTTDDNEIIETVKQIGLNVPFIRPAELASDQSGTYEVLLHALQHYENQGICYDILLLLQPTSPFRLKKHIEEALSLYNEDCDMVVSVKESPSNPYYNLFEENPTGYLQIAKGEGKFTRRQDAPKVWEYNGSIYVINIQSLKRMPLSDFSKRIKYPMDDIFSVDIDTPLDWLMAESILKSKQLQ